MFVQGIGRIDPFNRWHSIKYVDEHISPNVKAYTTSCDLYMTIVNTAESFQEIPLSTELCQTQACNIRAKLSTELNKCAQENRQSEWKVVY